MEYKKDFFENLTKLMGELLKKNKKVFLCCDANIAHNEIEVNKPKQVSRKSGFLPEERILLSNLLKNGFKDSFRELNPKVIQCTWRLYRARKENNDL